MDPSKLSPTARRAMGLIEFDEEEVLIREIRKHPIGLFFIYFGGSFVIFMLLMLAIVTAAFMKREDVPDLGFDLAASGGVVIAFCILLALLALVLTAVAAYLYRSNVLLVSSDKLAQILNPSLFNRKISQLNIHNVEDVTVTQRGILPHMFNYGTLVVETAGEQQNYTFTYIPNPYDSAKAILGAHEKNVKRFGN